ncbi:MAG: heavy metal translocating P-type ATPase, partial [Clostridiales bacterium]
MLLQQPTFLPLILFLTAYLCVGGDVLHRAIRSIGQGDMFNENFLMSIATIGALVIGAFPEAVAVMLFYQVGELFQGYAVARSRNSITDLMNIRPDHANLKQGNQIVCVDPNQVMVGDLIVVKPGERIPLDGRVIEGNSALDTSALTGESLPRQMTPGTEALSGCVNLNGLLTVEVTKLAGESTISKILELVENAAAKKSQSERFITKFARYYTPCVVAFAVLLAVLPPLSFAQGDFSIWVYRALSFLVVSCPCALVISVPLSFFGGIGGAARLGILIKGGNYLEALAKTEIVAFDKTGTLSKGIFEVQQIDTQNIAEEQLLQLAAYAENYSNHPIAAPLKRAYGREIDQSRIGLVQELAGFGVRAEVDGKIILVGNAKLMDKEAISYQQPQLAGTVVYVAADGLYQGCIIIADQLKEQAAEALQALKKVGVRKIVMLTGDSQTAGAQAAKTLKLDAFYAELLPGDKVARMNMLAQEKSASGKLVFVGDGINDAPVLAGADIGIAMGALGSDAAIEAADIVIMTDELMKI